MHLTFKKIKMTKKELTELIEKIQHSKEGYSDNATKPKLSKTEVIKIITPILNENWQTLKDIQRQTKPQINIGLISSILHTYLRNIIDCSTINHGMQEWKSTKVFRLRNV